MGTGFYERLGLQPQATPQQVRDAYNRTLARLVRKRRGMRAKGGDTTAIEAERAALKQAYEVLSDPVRRRRYDHFLAVEGQPVPQDIQSIRAMLAPALVDPAAVAAVELLRDLTRLPVGPSLETHRPAAIEPPPPMPASAPTLSMLSAQERMERARLAVEPVPEPRGLPQAPPQPAIQLASPIIQIPPPSRAAAQTDQGVAVQAAAAVPGRSADLRVAAAHSGYDGRYIATVRNSLGMSLQHLCATTRISERYLQAIEANAFDRLPAAVFVRGYLKEIAGVLDIEPGPLVEGYMALFAQRRGG